MKPRIEVADRPVFDQFCSLCHNRAVELLRRKNRTEDQTLEMLDCAHVVHEMGDRVCQDDGLEVLGTALLAECYLAARSLELATIYARRGLAKCKRMGSLVELGQFHKILARIECAHGSPVKALDVLDLALKELGDLPSKPDVAKEGALWTDWLEPGIRQKVLVAESLRGLRASLEKGVPVIDIDIWRSVKNPAEGQEGTPVPVTFVKNDELWTDDSLDSAIELIGHITGLSERDNPDDLEHRVYRVTYEFELDGVSVSDEIEFSINTAHIEWGIADYDLEEFEEGLQPGQLVHLKVVPQAPFSSAVHFGAIVDAVMQHEAVWR